MFKDFKLIAGRPVSIQVKDYMKHLIIKSALQGGQKLPSTRELSTLLKVSRNSVISAYEGLEDDGFAYTVQGQGSYVAQAQQRGRVNRKRQPGAWTGQNGSAARRCSRRSWTL